MNSPRRQKAAPIVVAVVALALAVGGGVVSRQFVRAQEQRLLEHASANATSVLTTTFLGAESSLRVLNGIDGPPDPNEVRDFLLRPGPLGGPTVAVTTVFLDDPALAPPRRELAERAVRTGKMVTAVLKDGQVSRLVLAVAGPAPDRWATLQESLIAPAVPIPQVAGTPFSELRGIVFLSTAEDDASRLIMSEGWLPVTGRIVRTEVPVGANTFVLVARARVPLVGAFAAQFPLLVLMAGVLVAAFATVAAHVLTRRRDYAMRLVGERTAELTDTLAELTEAQQIAEAASNAKSKFLSHVSHELRTPLNAILGFGQLLQTDVTTPAQHESVEQIVEGGRHLLTLVNELLDISSIESGYVRLETEVMDPRAILRECADLMASDAERAHVALTVATDSVPASKQIVFADPLRVRQVMLNLLSNAIKYNREGGTVTVITRALPGDRLGISVVDTGRGIAASRMSRLFTPFERLGAEDSDVAGIGLGLALSRQLARAMNGDLTVVSSRGEGSTFTLELPSATAAALPVTPMELGVDLSYSGRST